MNLEIPSQYPEAQQIVVDGKPRIICRICDIEIPMACAPICCIHDSEICGQMVLSCSTCSWGLLPSMLSTVGVLQLWSVQQCVSLSPRGISMYEHMGLVRRGGEGCWSERTRDGNCCSIRRNKALSRMCFGARGAVSSAQCVLTSDAGPDTLVI